MPAQSMKTVNRFEVKGKIGSISRRNFGKPARFFINSFINKRDVNLMMFMDGEIPEGINDGDTVIVRGFITTPPVGYGRRERYRNIFHAESIEPSKSEMEKEFGTEGKYQSSDYFKASFRGYVVRAGRISDSWGKLTIAVDTDVAKRGPSRLSMDYQLNNNMYSSLPEFNYEFNEPVQIICSIATSSKIIGGEKVFFQDLKVEDIQKLSPPTEE